MSFNKILQLIDNGLEPEQIISYVQQASPGIAKKISKMLLGGYGAGEIVNFLLRDKEASKVQMPKGKAYNPADISRLATIQNKMNVPKDRDQASRDELKKLTGQGLALAGMVAPFALQSKAGQALMGMIPEIGSQEPISPQPSPAIGQQVQAQAQAPVQAAMQPVTPQQTVTPAAPTVKASELLQSTGKLQSIDNLLAAGNDPGTIAKALGGLAPKKILQDIETQAGKPLEQVVADYAAETQPQKQQIAPIEEMEKAPIEETTLEPQKIKASKEISKGEGVVTESGEIGTVKGVSGNNFLVEDESGKISQVPMDKLRAQPEAIKKAKIVFDPSEIPEDERSAALAISLPMPDRSAIINMFHDGSFYIYKRKDGKAIDEDIVRRIIDGTDHPISTGDTFMGLYNPGKGDSRGSASYKELTSMAQKMGDPDDPNKPLTFEKITDSFVHGYYKKFINLLREATKLYGAKPKKEKKKAK